MTRKPTRTAPSAKPAQSPPVAPPQTHSPAQQARIEAVAAKSKARADGPPMKLKIVDGALQITFTHANTDLAHILMMADLGTCDPSFMAGVQGQIAAIGAHGRNIDEGASNFLLSVVRGVQPRDELEAMLAVQMGAIHQATMMMARRLNHVDTITQQDAAERALNKLARTYATQMEALKRYRTGGQQKVTVEHVTVNAGGRAIVGAVAHGGRGSNEK
jgi:hypothetical protein